MVFFQLGNFISFVVAIYKLPFILLVHAGFTLGFKLQCLPTRQGKGKWKLLHLASNYPNSKNVNHWHTLSSQNHKGR